MLRRFEDAQIVTLTTLRRFDDGQIFTLTMVKSYFEDA